MRNRRVLVTGGGTFLGDNVAAALLANGVDVTLLVRPGAEDHLGPLQQRARCYTADVWDPASLRGRARNHASVIHTVGSLIADPAQGLTYHRLNFVSARNVANMCVTDGVPHIVLLSSARAPWINRRYLSTKRDAERYVKRIGLKASIIRAPILYVRGQPRPLFYQLMTLLGGLPPVSWLGFNHMAPMPVDILARGVARIALEGPQERTVFYAPDLRRRNSRHERRGLAPLLPTGHPGQPYSPYAFHYPEDDVPFGWTPDSKA